MNFDEFVCYAKEHILDLDPELKEKAKVKVSSYLKNNGKKVTALSIFEGDGNVSPTIRLEDHFECYKDGKSLYDCMDDMLSIYREYRLGEFDISCYIDDFERAAPHLIIKLLGIEKNKELLEKMPHYVFGDLAVTFSICIRDKFGKGGIAVTNSIFKGWGIDIEKMLEAAFNNMQENDSVVIFPFDPISIMESRNERMCRGIPDIEEGYPYILSNIDGIFGASSLLRLDILQSFADKSGHNIYVLPLSIDECLLIQDDGKSEAETLRQILSDINRDVNPQEYVLSNSVYYYDRKHHQLSNSACSHPMILMKAGENYEAG